MGLITNKNNSNIETQQKLSAQQKSFACSYSKDVVVAMIEKGHITEVNEIREHLKEFVTEFQELLE